MYVCRQVDRQTGGQVDRSAHIKHSLLHFTNTTIYQALTYAFKLQKSRRSTRLCTNAYNKHCFKYVKLAHISQSNDVDEPISSFHSIYFANSTHRPVYLSTCPPVHLSTCLPVHLSTTHETSVNTSPLLCKQFFIVWGILNLSLVYFFMRQK